MISQISSNANDKLFNELTGTTVNSTEYARDIITIVKEEFNKIQEEKSVSNELLKEVKNT